MGRVPNHSSSIGESFMITERMHSRRTVKWRGSVNSDPIDIKGTSAWKLFVPSTYAGTSIAIQVFVERSVDANDPVAGEDRIDGWKDYDTGTITLAKDEVMDLTDNNLAGIDRIRFVSNASETCTGELQVST